MTRSTSRSLHRARLLTGAALVVGASPALAQTAPPLGFQAEGVVTGGSSMATIVQETRLDGGPQTRVDVLQSEAIINWTPVNAPSRGNIQVLPSGHSLVFESGSDFVVLNRVLPTLPDGSIRTDTPIRFDGLVQSLVDGVKGGSVWFYSPGGMILGGSSVFDVGSLVLSASDIADGDVRLGSTGIGFGLAANPDASITIESGARVDVGGISPLGTGNYLAIVAPKIEQGGTVRVNGSAAYIAAEKVTVSINAGLFGMSFDTGSAAENPIKHTGITTGVATPSGPQNIVMASVPKNSAITLLLGGQIGFDTSVGIDNGAIVLSAGYTEVASLGNPSTDSPASARAGNIKIESGIMSSRLAAHASGAVTASPNDGQQLTFLRSTLLQGRASAEVRADQNEVVTFADAGADESDLILRSSGGTAGLYATYDAEEGGSRTLISGGRLRIDAGKEAESGLALGGTAELVASGAMLNLGRVRVGAVGQGRSDPDAFTSANGQGGIARVSLTSDAMLMAADLTVDASGIGGDTASSAATGRNGRGGLASLTTTDSNLLLDSSLNVRADGISGSGGNEAGNGFGGEAAISITGGMLMTSGLQLEARGIAVEGFDSSGAAEGGSATLLIVNGAEVDAGSFVDISASARADSPFPAFSGGATTGGNVVLTVDDAALTATRFDLSASARGGDARFGVAGAASGGTIELTSRFGGAITSSTGMTLDARGTAGSGSDTGAGATGGRILTTLQGGRVDLQGGSFSADVSAQISLAPGATPMLAKAGSIQIDVLAGGADDPAPALNAPAGLQLFADAREENPLELFDTGNSATGVGGVIRVDIAAGSVATGNMQLSASGSGGAGSSGGPGGAGVGGRIALSMSGGQLSAAGLTFRANALGGDGVDVESGYGTAFTESAFSEFASELSSDSTGGTAGGTANIGPNPLGLTSGVSIDLTGGTLISSGQINLIASAEGGSGGNVSTFEGDMGAGGMGGAAQGGVAFFRAGPAATVQAGSIFVEANATGGDGGDIWYFTGAGSSPAGMGGAATGGSAELSLAGQVLGGLFGQSRANATAGNGGEVLFFGAPTLTAADSAGGRGGDALGGRAFARMSGSIGTSFVLVSSAEGTGGAGGGGAAGGAGGIGEGGQARLELAQGSVPASYTLFSSRADASGSGGSAGAGRLAGGNGGQGRGGNAAVDVSGDITVTMNGGGAFARGFGAGGAFGGASGTPSPGGAGGAGFGGEAVLSVERANLTLFAGEGGLIGVNASAFGGNGGSGLAGSPATGGPGGNGTGGFGLIQVSAGTLTTQAGSLFQPSVNGIGGAGGGPADGGTGPRGPAGLGQGGDLLLRAQDETEAGILARMSIGRAELRSRGVNGDFSDGKGGSVSLLAEGNATDGIISFEALTIETSRSGEPSGIVSLAGTGLIKVAGDLRVRSGGDVDIGAGARLAADRGVFVFANDDISVGLGARLRSAVNPPVESGYGATDPLQQLARLELIAGTGETGRPAGEISFIIFDGDLEATDRTVLLSADAIQSGAASTIRGANIFARIRNAPLPGRSALTEDGTLRTECAQGNVCLGRVFATNLVRIGETGFVPNRLSLIGGIDAKDVLLRTRDTMLLGSPDAIDFIKASNALLIESTAGDVLIDGTLAVESGATVRLAAARDLIGAGATLRSPGSIDLTVGRNVTLAGLDASQLRTLDGSGAVVSATGLDVAGAITFTDTVKLGTGLTLRARTGIDVAAADLKSGAIDFASAGTVRLGAAGTGALGVPNQVLLTGDTVLLGDVASGGAITAKATNAIEFLKLDAAGALSLTTGGDIKGGDARAAAMTLATSGGSLDVGALETLSGALTLVAPGGLAVKGASSATELTLSSNNVTAGSLDAKGSITVLASKGAATIGSATAGDDLTVGAANGIGFAALTAAQDLTLSSGGGVSGGKAVGGRVVISGSGLTKVGDVTATAGALSLTGALVQTGNLTGSGAIDVTATSGGATLGIADAAGALSVKAGGAVSFASLDSDKAVTVVAGSAMTGGNVTGPTLDLSAGSIEAGKLTATAGDLTAVTKGAISVLGATATGAVDLSGADVKAATLTAGGSLTVLASGAAALGTATSGSTIDVSAAGPLTFTDVTAGAALALDSETSLTGGNATGAAVTLTAGGALEVNIVTASSGDLTLAALGDVSLTKGSSTGAFTLVTTGAATLGTVNSKQDAGIAAGGPVSFTSLTAAEALTVESADGVTGGDAAGKNVTLIAERALSAGALRADGGDLTVSAGDAVGLASASATGRLSLAGSAVKAPALTAGGPLTISAAGEVTLGNASSNDAVEISAAGPVGFANLTAAQSLKLDAKGDVTGGTVSGMDLLVVSDGSISANRLSATKGDLQAQAGGALTVVKADASGALLLAGMDVTAQTLVSGGTLSVSATGSAALGSATSGDAIAIGAAGPVSFATLTASKAIAVTGKGVTGGDATGASVTLTSGGTLSAGKLSATNGDLDVLAEGTITLASATATGALDLSGADVKAATLSAGGSLTVLASGAAALDTATSGGALDVTAAGPLTFTDLTAGAALALESETSLTGSNATGTAVALTSGGALTAGNVTASSGDLTLAALGDVSLTKGSSTGALTLVTAGAATLGTAGSQRDIGIAAGGPVSFTSLTAAEALTVESADGVTGGSATGKSVTLIAERGLSADTLTAEGGDLTISAGDAVAIAGASATDRLSLAGSAVKAPALTAGGALTITASGAVTLGSASSNDFVDISAAGPVGFVGLTAAQSLKLDAKGDVTGGSASGMDLLVVSDGAISADRLSATKGDLQARAGGALTVAKADAGGALLLAGKDVTAQTLLSGRELSVSATGSAALGSATSGDAIAIGAAGPVSFATLTAAKAIAVTGKGVTGGDATGASVTLASGGTVSAGKLSATDGDLEVFADGAITLDTANAAGALSVAGSEVKAAKLGSGGALTVESAGTASLGSVTSGDAIEIAATDALDFTSLTAGKSLTAAANGISGGEATGASVTLLSGNTLGVNRVSATAGDLNASATGALTLGKADASGALALTGADVTAPALSAGGPITLTAAGAATLGSLTSFETTSIEAAGPVSFASIAATKAVALNGASDVTGDVVAGTDLTLTAGSNLSVRSLKAAGDLEASATGALVIDDAVAAGSLALAGEKVTTVNVTAGGSLTVTAADAATLGIARSDETLRVTAGGPVTFASLSAASALDVSGQGDVTGQEATGKSLALDAGGQAKVGKLTATGGDLTATAGQLLDLGSATAASSLRVSGAELATPILTAGTKLIAASLGDATFATALSADSIDLTATGLLTVADAKASKGGANLTGATIVIGKVEAAGALTATAAGLITVDGLATGSTVELTSGDIAIGSTAQVGRTAETGSVTLTSTSGRAAVGGSETAGLYRLTDAELDRVASKGDITVAVAPTSARQNLVFDLQDPGGATFLVDALSFSGAQLGASGTLRFVSPGSIGVIGGARFDGMSAGQSVLLQAANDIALAGETGSLALRDVSGNLAGSLRLDTRHVHALSAAGRAALRTAPDLAAASLRLAQQDGLTSQDGFFSAGGLVARVSRAFFVQNSGAEFDVPDARRGISVGTGGLRIESTGTAPAAVAISGRVLNTSGSFVTGGAAVPVTTVSGALDPAATLNGCLFNNPASCAPIRAVVTPPVVNPPVVEDPIPLAPALDISRDFIVEEASSTEEEEERKGEGGASKLPQPIIEILRVPQNGYDPLIDEPVTGSGNDDLWDGAPIPAPGGPGL